MKPKPLAISDADREGILARFLPRIATDGPDACWEWVGYVDPAGYGGLSIRRVMERAHRISYALFVGPLDDVLTIDHLCRNKTCVNPAHLELVTFEENLRRRRLDVRGETCLRGGQLHHPGCDMERCPRCGGQAIWPCAERGRARMVSDEDVTFPQDRAPTGGLDTWDF